MTSVDLDWNFDFDFGGDETKYNEVDICGLAKKMKSKERHFFNLQNEVGQLSAICKTPPTRGEVIKAISVGGGWSCLAFIKWIADIEGIDEMWVSTFRIGKNHINELNALYRGGKLGKCHFVTSATQKKVDDKMIYNGKEYRYFDYICEICKDNDWELRFYDNHSKIVLMRTKQNWYVLETSSNLNENPKMEQFSFENDKGLFDFYLQVFEVLLQ